MAEADWAELNDSLDQNTVRRLVTGGITPPNGGGSFVFGFRSLATTEGAVGFYPDLANFNPTAANKGGSIRGAMLRASSSGIVDYCPFFAIGVQGGSPPSVLDSAYLIGLSDDSPSKIILRKGLISEGIPAGAVGESGILRKSDRSVAIGDWVHLRLDMVVNGNGDVNLRVFESDLADNAVTAPDWQAIDGMEDYLDDALGAASGSLPYTSGFFAFCVWSKALNRVMAFDHIEVIRQN